MDTKDLTTEALLRLEEAGGMLTSAIPPDGILPNDSLHAWLAKMPLVDGKLLARWYDLYRARIALEVQIDRLRHNAKADR
jgi:hypothetical protein